MAERVIPSLLEHTSYIIQLWNWMVAGVFQLDPGLSISTGHLLVTVCCGWVGTASSWLAIRWLLGTLTWDHLKKTFGVEVASLVLSLFALFGVRYTRFPLRYLRIILAIFVPLGSQILVLDLMWSQEIPSVVQRFLLACTQFNPIALNTSIWFMAPNFWLAIILCTWCTMQLVGCGIIITMDPLLSSVERIIVWRTVGVILVFGIGFLMFLGAADSVIDNLLRRYEELRVSREHFLNRISHDLRTPLSGIIGYAELMLSPASSMRQLRSFHSSVESVAVCAREALGLVDEVLDWSLIQSGKLTLRKEDFSIGQLTKDIHYIIAGLMHDKNLRFTMNTSKCYSGTLVGDPRRLRQVVIGLLGNARKFSHPRGRVHCELSSTPLEDGSGEMLTVVVEDQGIGFTGNPSKLFEAHVQQVQLEGGVGLGLAIARDLTVQMGGRISAHSDGPNQGARFWFEIPLPYGGRCTAGSTSSTTVTHPAVNIERIGLHVSPRSGRRSLRVMCIDDSRILLSVIEKQLANLKIPMDMFLMQSSLGAVELLETSFAQNNHFDVIITDIHLPGGLDGFEIASIVRMKEDRYGVRKCRLVGLSASTDIKTIQRMRTAVFDAFLQKPVTQESLQSVFL